MSDDETDRPAEGLGMVDEDLVRETREMVEQNARAHQERRERDPEITGLKSFVETANEDAVGRRLLVADMVREGDLPRPVPSDAGQPECPQCGLPLIFAVEPGYEVNEWAAYCPTHGLVAVDDAAIKPLTS